MAGNEEPVIFVRPDTNTSDVGGFAVSAGILTAVGGRTAHAALVARQLAKPCIVRCANLAIEEAHGGAQLGGNAIREGDWLSIDGSAGIIHIGRSSIVTEQPERESAEIERCGHERLPLHYRLESGADRFEC
jgi:pyruvate, orthophosphate dikinase